MAGIELAERYFEEYGKPMLFEKFSHLLPFIAAGICGQGSECFGYDDEISKDHDYEPGFIVFIPGEDIVSRRDAFLLERAYSSLPKEFMGIKRLQIAPVGGFRHGVKRTGEFFSDIVGRRDGKLSPDEWLNIPEYLIAEAVNGKIFMDNYGEITKIRQRLSSMPEDVRRKKLAGKLIIMAQAGQYNYLRCLSHKEEAAAQLCIIEFAKKAMEAVFLLNKKPMPFYKWSFRALRELSSLGELADALEFLITTDNSEENSKIKSGIIENVSSLIAGEINKQSIAAKDSELERLAYAVNDSISDSRIRGLSIFA